MKKIVLFFLLILLVSCASKTQAIPTQEIKVATATLVPESKDFGPSPKEENPLLTLDEANFIPSLITIVSELLKRAPDQGLVLSKCDVGFTHSDSEETLNIVSSQEGNNCTIGLIRKVDYSTSNSVWKNYAPDENGRSIVAITYPLGENNYPLLFVPEGTYDTEYLIRVFGHEAVHINSLLIGTYCLDGAKECRIDEEVLAFQKQFELLDYYLSKSGQSYSFEKSGLAPIYGMNKLNQIGWGMERGLYFLNKEGTLKDYLLSNNYGGDAP